MRLSCRLVAALALLGLAGCAQVHVKSVATAPGETQAFELRSRTWPELEAQATRLCPYGHDVLRAYQGSVRVEREDWPVQGAWQKAVDGLGVGNGHSAQALVQCKPLAERRAASPSKACACGVLRQLPDDRMAGSGAAAVCAPCPAVGALVAPAPH